VKHQHFASIRCHIRHWEDSTTQIILIKIPNIEKWTLLSRWNATIKHPIFWRKKKLYLEQIIDPIQCWPVLSANHLTGPIDYNFHENYKSKRKELDGKKKKKNSISTQSHIIDYKTVWFDAINPSQWSLDWRSTDGALQRATWPSSASK